MVTNTESGPCPDHHTAAHRRRCLGSASRPPDACCPTGCGPGRSMAGQPPDTRSRRPRAPRQRFARHQAGSKPGPLSFQSEDWHPTSGLRPGIIDKPPWPVTSRHRPVIAAPHILRQPQAVRPSLPPSKQEAWSCLNPPGSRPGTSTRSPLLRSCLPGRQDAPGGKPTWTS